MKTERPKWRIDPETGEGIEIVYPDQTDSNNSTIGEENHESLDNENPADSSTVPEQSGGSVIPPSQKEITDPVDSDTDPVEVQSMDDKSEIQIDADSNPLNESAEDKTPETTAIVGLSSNSTECKSLVVYQHLNPIEFLNRIYQFVPDELRGKLFTYIWSRDNENHNKRTNSFKLSELDNMLEVAKNINTGYKNISFSMGLIDHPLGTHERAKSSDIVAIPCLWIDIDVANDVHGQNQKLAPTIETACEIITMQLGYDLKPSLVVDSGYGIHAYWILNSLFKIESDADLKRFQRMLETLQGIIRANLQSYFIDKTSDLSRMLRLPGTRNWKAGIKNDAPICKVIEASNTAFEIDEFELRLRERVEVLIPKSKNPREISTSQREFLEKKYSTSNADFSIDTENPQIKMLVENCAAVKYVVENIESMKYPVVAPILRTLLKIEGSEQFIFDLVKRWRGDKFDISTTERQLEGLKKLPPAQCLDLLAMGLPCNGGKNHECVVAKLGKKTPDAIRTSPLVRRAIFQDLGGTIGERFVDAPDQIKYLLIPDEFEMYENRIEFFGAKYVKSVSLTPFAIQNLVQNEGSESIAYYNFAIRKNERWIHRLIDAHIINKPADLANTLLDAGILVDASQIRLANKFTIAFLATNEENIETIMQYTKLGWRDNFEFIHPDFQFDENGNELYKLIRSDVVPHIHCKGSIESEIDLMKRACKYQNARTMYNMQFLAPLVKPLGIRNPILYICAESESGKTAALVGANSIFGDSEFMVEINGTKKSLVDRFVDRNDLPTNFNEWQHISEKDRAAYAENLIRTFESGKSRGKENRDGSQVPIKKYHGTLTITGEKELLNENDPHGLRTRCILLSVDGVVGNIGNDGKFITDNETCKLLWNNHKHNLNHGNLGIDFIRRLQSEFKIHGINRLIEMHSRNAELISKSRDGIQQSHIDFLAGLMLVDQLRLQFYENMNESEAFKSACEWINQIIQFIQTREQNRDVNGALHAIEDAFNRDESRFWDINGNLPKPYPVCGYKTQDEIYANPAWVRDVLKVAGYNARSETLALGKQGDLEIDLAHNDTSIVKKIEGKSRRVVGLNFLSKRNVPDDSLVISNDAPSNPEDVPPESIPF